MYVFVTTREKQATVKAVLSLNVLFVNVVSLAAYIYVGHLLLDYCGVFSGLLAVGCCYVGWLLLG